MREISSSAQSIAAAICWCTSGGSSPPTITGECPYPRISSRSSPSGMRASTVEELVRVPARGEGTAFRLAVPDDAEDGEAGVVESGTVGMDQGVAKLSALMDRSRRLRRVVTWDAAREGELAEQLAQPDLVHAHVRIALRVRALEVRVGDAGGAAMAGAHDVDRVEVPLLDRSVGVRVDEVQPGRRPPMPKQPRLDVLELQGLFQQRVIQQVDLPHRQVVGGAPV